MSDPSTIFGANIQDWWLSGSPGSPDHVYSDAGVTLVNADAQSIQRWLGKTNSTQFNYVVADSAYPKWDNALGCVQLEFCGAAGNSGAAEERFLESGFNVNRQSFTVGIVCELTSLRNAQDGSGDHIVFAATGANPLNMYYGRGGILKFYDGTTVATSASYQLHTSRILLIYSGDNAGSFWYYNGTQINVGAAQAAGTSTGMYLGYSPTVPCAMRIYGAFAANVKASSGNLSSLLTWAQGLGVQASYTANVVFDGDSLSVGAVPMNRNWQQQLALPAGVRQSNVAEPSIALSTLVSENYPTNWKTSTGKEDVVGWGGTNDFALNSAAEATVLASAKSWVNNQWTAAFNKVAFMTTLPRPSTGTFTDANLFTGSPNFCGDLRSNFDAGTLGTANASALIELDQDPTIGGTIANGNHLNTTYYNSDHTHLTIAGNAIVANLVYPFIAPWAGITAASYSVAGPATGTVNVATSSFTAALAGSCTFNGTQSIKITCPAGVTCTATAPGGTITGNGTGTVTVRPAAGQSGFTYPLTITGTGAKSITYNGYSGGTASPVNRGWTDAAAGSVTFSAASTSNGTIGDYGYAA
jgi:hypothetical protein